MEGGNHILHQGRISRLPLLLALMLCTVILIVAFGWFADTAQDTQKAEPQDNSVQGLVEYGGKRYAKLQKLKEAIHEEEESDPEELKAKAQVLLSEAQAAYEHASALEGAPLNNFKDDYQEYLNTVAPKKPQDPAPPKRSETFEKARTSKTRIALGGENKATGDASSTLKNGFEYLKSTAVKSISSANEKSQQRGRTLEAYQSLISTEPFEMDAVIHNLKSPWCLRQGSVIPAVLLSGINSDLPGLVSAQVTEDVLDSIDASEVLIPAGTKITGQYEAAPAYGQERLFIAFDRLLFPGGQSLSLDGMPGQASDGYSGFDAKVNTHFMRMVSNALLLSTISAGAGVANASNDSSHHQSYGNAFSQNASASLGQVLGKIIERNLNLSPTLEINPGYLFNIAVTKDMYFKTSWDGNCFKE